MSENCFLKQEATLDIISNVVSFCAECYQSVSENETIFYDMKSFRYLCVSCQQNIQLKIDEKSDNIDDNNQLFV